MLGLEKVLKTVNCIEMFSVNLKKKTTKLRRMLTFKIRQSHMLFTQTVNRQYLYHVTFKQNCSKSNILYNRTKRRYVLCFTIYYFTHTETLEKSKI